jgi:hypothetical protein
MGRFLIGDLGAALPFGGNGAYYGVSEFKASRKAPPGAPSIESDFCPLSIKLSLHHRTIPMRGGTGFPFWSK